MRVSSPTAKTTAVAFPTMTSLPSSRTLAASLGSSAAFATGSDSPVSAASSTSSESEPMSRASTGTRSPGPRTMTSPGTTSCERTETGRPSRITSTLVSVSWASNSAALPAWCSCQAPTAALAAITATMSGTSA